MTQANFATVEDVQTWQRRATTLEHELAAAQAEAAQLRPRAALADELTQIVMTLHYSPTERVTLAALRINAQRETTGQYMHVTTGSATAIADAIGLSRPTVSNALAKFEQVKLISSHTERSIVNRYGEVLDRSKLNGRPMPEDCHWDTSVSRAVVTQQPDQLPKLATTEREQRDRTRAKERNALAKIAKELQDVACPECGTVGEWALECKSCGAHFDAAELAKESYGQESTPPKESYTPPITTETDNLPDLTPRKSLTPPPEAHSEATITTPRQDFDDISMSVKSFTSTEGALRGGMGEADESPQATPRKTFTPPPEVQDGKILTGVATLTYLAGLGATFVLLQPRGKDPFERDWQHKPHTLAEALTHLARGGNVGMLTGAASGGLIVPDADAGVLDLLDMRKELARAPMIMRDNAPDRGKFVIGLDGDEADITQHMRSDSKDKPTHKLEILSTGYQALVAGIHPSGEVIKMRLPRDCARVALTPAQIAITMAVFVPEDYRDRDKPTTQSKQANTPPLSARLQGEVPDACRWYAALPEVQSEAMRLIEKCPRKGEHFAIRKERTPSARIDYDGFGRLMITDWGDGGKKLDALGIICLLGNRDKRDEIRRIMPLYRKAQETSNGHAKRTQTQQALRTLAPVARAMNV